MSLPNSVINVRLSIDECELPYSTNSPQSKKQNTPHTTNVQLTEPQCHNQVICNRNKQPICLVLIWLYSLWVYTVYLQYTSYCTIYISDMPMNMTSKEQSKAAKSTEEFKSTLKNSRRSPTELQKERFARCRPAHHTQRASHRTAGTIPD